MCQDGEFLLLILSFNPCVSKLPGLVPGALLSELVVWSPSLVDYRNKAANLSPTLTLLVSIMVFSHSIKMPC